MATPYSPSAPDSAHTSSPPAGGEPRTYSFGRFALDVSGQRLFRDGEMLPLTGRVFETLLVLIRHRNRVVTKDELLHLVWHDTNVSEDSLTHNISILRRTFGDDATQPRYVATSARRGYRFIADVTESAAPVTVSRGAPPAEIPMPAGTLTAGRRVVSLMVAVALVAAVIGGTISARLPHTPVDTSIRVLFSLDPPSGERLVSSGLLSPDGRHVAFVAQDMASNIRRLWVRSIESGDTRVVTGTEGAWRAFWSPDSRVLGFFADSRIKRVGLMPDDPPRVIGTTFSSTPAGGAWSALDVIVYPDAGSLYSIPAEGGVATVVKRLDPAGEQVTLGWPQLMPDAEHLLYSVSSANRDRVGTYFGSLSSRPDVRVLPEAGESVVYAAPGHVVFVRNGVVMAQGFDNATGRLSGAPSPLVGQMVTREAVSASLNGLVSFGGGAIDEHLTWVDRAGHAVERLPGIPPLHNLVLSHDGRTLLGDAAPPRTTGAWLVDLERNVPTQVSTDVARQPHWSPGGDRIAFTAQRGGVRGIYVQPTPGGRADELVLQSDEMKFLSDWTRDGRFLVFVSWNDATKQDLWLLPMSGDRQPRAFLRTPAREIQAQVSPDGRWIAYASDDSGRLEVYVDSFPAPGAKVTISNGGGGQPQWRRDGKELFYLTSDGTLMAVNVVAGDAALRIARAQPLFRTTLNRALSDDRNIYTAAADGQRFLISSPDIGAEPERITVLANWTAALRGDNTARTALSRLAGLLQ